MNKFVSVSLSSQTIRHVNATVYQKHKVKIKFRYDKTIYYICGPKANNRP